jgi:SPOR domain
MKYTRYNIKQKNKNKNNFLLYLIITLVIALTLGTGLSFLFHKGDNKGQLPTEIDKSKENTKTEQNNEVNKGQPNHQFYLLQCGVFKVKENAETLRKSVEGIGNPFIVEEGELFRVYFGVYSKEQWETAANLLKEKGISYSKSTLDVYYEDLSTGELCQIIEANFKIINKASEPNIKSVKTTELKNWANSLQSLEEGMKQYNDVNELKTYIQSLPEEINKTKAAEMIVINYNKLKQFKK